jgi:glyoxylase-like metal-dependent hydrolase (beta-lactamase superfamily II)
VVRRVLAGRSNAFLLSSGSGQILVDAGRRNRWPALERRLAELGVDRLDALVLTHTHFDHAENACRVRARYQAKVVVHESEACFLERGDAPLPAGTVLPTMVLTRRLRSAVQPWFRYPGCPADLVMRDRLDLSTWGFNGFVLHTPGHSRGSMSVVLDDELAVVGDAMFGGVPWSVWPPFADDVGQLVESWRRLLETGCRVFLPGHRRPIDRRLLEKCFTKRRRRT